MVLLMMLVCCFSDLKEQLDHQIWLPVKQQAITLHPAFPVLLQ